MLFAYAGHNASGENPAGVVRPRSVARNSASLTKRAFSSLSDETMLYAGRMAHATARRGYTDIRYEKSTDDTLQKSPLIVRRLRNAFRPLTVKR